MSWIWSLVEKFDIHSVAEEIGGEAEGWDFLSAGLCSVRAERRFFFFAWRDGFLIPHFFSLLRSCGSLKTR